MTVNDYIAKFPLDVQKKLKQMRAIVKKAAPKAEEKISYGMPGYKLDGPLVYFAAFKNHIGFYPMPSALKKFKDEIKEYKSSKGAVQFPLDEKLPLKIIEKMVRFRVKENRE